MVDKRREKEEEKKKEEKADRMCTSYRSDTIIEITVNDRQGEGERRLSKFMADSRLRRITNAHFAEIRAFSRPTLKYFQSNWVAR